MYVTMFLVLLHFGYAIGSQLPRITEHPADLTVPRHEPATLYCSADGQPPPHIEWLKDGHLVRPSANRVLLPAGALLFLRVAPRDAGVYQCSATNAEGVATSRNASLQVGVLREEFRVEPSNLRVAQGETALLECAPPRGAPEPQVYWNKNGLLLDPSTSNRIEIVDGGNLAIKNARKSDEGGYQCVAKNAVGVRESAVAQLKVHVKPFIVRGPEDAVVVAGASVVFSCEAGGDPVPDVLWRRTAGGGNMPLGRVHVLEDRSLKLEAVTQEDEGEYSCEVDNAVGGLAAEATLTVHTPPVITVRPSELTAEEGQDAVFTCGIKGKPSPTVFWIIETNHTLLLPGSRSGRYLVSTADEGYLTLTIKEVEKIDDGLVVMCGAVNVVGSDSWFARLAVVSPGDYPPPIIQLGASNQTLPLHTPGILVCRAEGEPTPVITWYKDGIPVTPEPPAVALAEDGTLVISDLVKSDEGFYTCVASSRRGKATWSSTLQLEPRTNPNAAFFRSPEPSTLPGPPSQPALVASIDSSLTISWTRNNKIGSSSLIGYQIEMFSRSLTDKHTTGSWVVVARRVSGPTYTLNYLQHDTSYRFVVRAENSHGLSPASPPSTSLSLSFPSHSNLDTSVKEARASLSTGHVVELTSVQAVSSTSVKLAWEILSSDYVEGVLILSQGLELHTNTTSMLTVLHTGDTSGFLVTGLRPYTRYRFFLVPFFKEVDGRPSNSKIVRTLEDVPSEPPSHIEAVLDSKSTVKLTWKHPPLDGQNGILVSYQIIVRVGDYHHGPVLSNVTADAATPSLLLTNLTAGVVYTVQTAAATRVGVGPYSAPSTLRLDPSTRLLGNGRQPIEVQPSLEMTKPDLLSETWFMALLGSMVAVMVVFFSAMLYVWRKQMINNKGYLPDSRTNGGAINPPLGFKSLLVGLPQRKPRDSDLWIDANCGVRDKCQLYNEVPQVTQDYAEVTMRQQEFNQSAAYAYTTLVPPPPACNLTDGSGHNRSKHYETSYTSFGYYDRKVYSDNYNCFRNQVYSKLNGNGSMGVPVTMVVPQSRRRVMSDSDERETESSQLDTPPPLHYPPQPPGQLATLPPLQLPPQPPRYQRALANTQLIRPHDNIYQKDNCGKVNATSKYDASTTRTLSTFCKQNLNHTIYHKSTRSEPPR